MGIRKIGRSARERSRNKDGLITKKGNLKIKKDDWREKESRTEDASQWQGIRQRSDDGKDFPSTHDCASL